MLRDRNDAYRLLSELRAPDRLLRHLRLVGEAADLLIAGYDRLDIPCDAGLIRLGVAVHDAGKILFPNELDGPGSEHESAGKALMLANGVQPEVAECCVSHAAWHLPHQSLEALSVALSDKLWKGKREDKLELLLVDSAVSRLRVGRWDAFETLDSLFERIAAGASDRLARS
jgi:hypothetical protein